MCVFVCWGVGRGRRPTFFWVERAPARESGAQGSNCSLTQTCCAI